MEFLTSNLNLFAGGGASALVLWALKKIPNKDIQDWVGTAGYWVGATVTLGLAKWKLTRSVWNSTIEPYFIDLLDNTVNTFIKNVIKGMKSDN